MIFIIATSNTSLNDNSNLYWGKEYFKKILQFNKDNINELSNINSAIVYFTKAQNKDNLAYKLNILSSKLTDNYLLINYKIDRQLEFKSYHVRNSLKRYFEIHDISSIPFCTIVDENKFIEILSDIRIQTELDILIQKNNWSAIYEILKNYFPLEKSYIWNDPTLLNKFSFATAKLAECTVNLKKMFQDKKDKNKFIEEKRYYRNLTLKLRTRCIELEPHNAAFYSSLAYSYYQSINELTRPNGRRDGKIIDEINNALNLLDKAIELNPTNIKDYYRKGIILSEIMTKQTLFVNNEQKQYNEIKMTTYDLLKKSELSFEQLIKNYESDPEQNKIHKKYYIKALYHLALTYIKLFRNKIKVDDLIIDDNEHGLNYAEPINYLELADKTIDKCIIADYNRNENSKNLLDLVEQNNYLCGAYKAYIKGVINLYLYITKKDDKYKNISYEYLMRANEIRFPEELKRQNKIFILDKLATLNLLEKKSAAAIKILEPIYRRGLPDYAQYTLALAYYKNNQLDNALNIIEEQLKKENTLKNKFERLKRVLESRLEKKNILDNHYTRYINIESKKH